MNTPEPITLTLARKHDGEFGQIGVLFSVTIAAERDVVDITEHNPEKQNPAHTVWMNRPAWLRFWHVVTFRKPPPEVIPDETVMMFGRYTGGLITAKFEAECVGDQLAVRDAFWECRTLFIMQDGEPLAEILLTDVQQLPPVNDVWRTLIAGPVVRVEFE